MAIYGVGDLQGCVAPLRALLDRVNFDPSQDRLWLTGDLVNRGPDSLGALRLVKELGASAITILGNHDLHLLAVLRGTRDQRPGDTLDDILSAPDRDELTQWLRHLPLVHVDESLKLILVHAGVYPGWNLPSLRKYAGEVEAVLQGDDLDTFLTHMYGKKPKQWQDSLTGWDRLRFITNAFTRMRFCDPEGRLEFSEKLGPGSQPAPYLPWFDHPNMKCQSWRIVFGHWSTLGFMRKDNLISLDSGCVWGQCLTMVRLDGEADEFWQQDCMSC